MRPREIRSSSMNPITLLVTVVLGAIGALLVMAQMPQAGAVFFILAALTLFSLKMANNWERFVILRAGKLSSVKGPGLFMIIPVIDAIAAVIDERIQTTQFNAEQALTRDTVPVNVDAVIFWHVHDAQRAALNITDYRQAIDRVAQTSLREMIGSSLLSALLAERKAADEREKEARVILGSAEAAIAQKFVDAARTYAGEPAALHLRAMNIIYETTKERGATILIPTSMVDSMSVALPAAMLAQKDLGGKS